MYCAPVAVTLTLLVHLAGFDIAMRAASTPGNDRDDIVCLSTTGSPEELAARIAKFLPTSTRTELGRLVAVSDCTAVMAAGWERVRRTMPETMQEAAVTPDILAISRFLGLIEGRLQVPIPKTWEETVKCATGYGQKNIWFPRSDLVLVTRHTDQWHLERDGAHWLVRKDSRSIKLPAKDVLGPVFHATVECAGELAYVALYGPPCTYRLFAIDQASGKVMWSSEVWGSSKVWPPGVIVHTSGSDWHAVTMRSSGETLAVFGFSGGGVYVDAFDRKTGVNLCRFNTAYFDFDAFAPRK